MTSRTLIILAGALVVLALLAVYGQRSDAPPPSRSGELLLPDLAAALGEVDRIEITNAGGTKVATLERGAEAWTVSEKSGYPGDIAKIRAVLRSLAEARIVEEKTSNPAYYDRLGVADIDSEEARGIGVTAFAGNGRAVDVIVGDSADGRHYVRLAGEAESYLIDTELDVPRTTADWLDRIVIDVPSTRIASVTVEHPDGETLHIEKASADETNFSVDGIPEGRELTYPGAANVIANTLRDLRLDDVRPVAAEAGDAAKGADGEGVAASGGDTGETRTTTTFRTFDGLVVVATTVERDGERWVRFAAQADAAATGASADGGDAAAAEADDAAVEAKGDDASVATDDDNAAIAEAGEGADGAETDGDDADPAEEARAIDARVGGWEYKLPEYQTSQLTRRIDALLEPEADESEDGESEDGDA